MEPLLSTSIRVQLISYIFFNHFYKPDSADFIIFLFVAVVVYFFMGFLVKYLVFSSLANLLLDKELLSTQRTPLFERNNTDLRFYELYLNLTKPKIVFLAHIASHIGIVLMLLLQAFFSNSPF